MAGIGFTGVILMIPELNLKNSQTESIVWGVLSGFSFAMLAIFNRKFVQKYPGVTISFYEDLAATAILFPFLFTIPFVISVRSFVLILCLGVIFTGLAHTLFINGMKKIKPQQASILANLEPLYGILLAVLILKEIPTVREIAGGSLIMATAFYTSIKLSNTHATRNQ